MPSLSIQQGWHPTCLSGAICPTQAVSLDGRTLSVALMDCADICEIAVNFPSKPSGERQKLQTMAMSAEAALLPILPCSWRLKATREKSKETPLKKTLVNEFRAPLTPAFVSR